MQIDISNLSLPEPESVMLLKAEVRRLQAIIAASDPVLTDEERFVLSEVRDMFADEDAIRFNEMSAVIDALLERTK